MHIMQGTVGNPWNFPSVYSVYKFRFSHYRLGLVDLWVGTSSGPRNVGWLVTLDKTKLLYGAHNLCLVHKHLSLCATYIY